MPIDYTVWPQTSDVQGLITSAGLWPTDSGAQTLAAIEVEVALDAAKNDFEMATGWHPFLAGDSVQTLFFDNTDPNGILNLGSALVDTDTHVPVVTVGVNYTGVGAPDNGFGTDNSYYLDTSTGTVYLKTAGTWASTPTAPGLYVMGTNFWLRQSNSLIDGFPFDQLQFVNALYDRFWLARPNQLTVTGLLGYCTELPPMAWNGVRVRAASVALLNMATLAAGQMTEMRQEEVTEKWNLGLPRQALLDRWQQAYDLSVSKFVRVVV